MNSRLNDTERRMPKSAGRQNKENHPITTAKRKTNLKKWEQKKQTNKKKCKQFERSLGCNIHIIEVPEREEQGNGIKSLDA